jgi:16S rRNA (uracil1498-N3)-methyltransferase
VNEKMDWIIEKAVELGVSTIIPVQTQRSVVRLHGEKEDKINNKLDHWSQIMISACEQCDRTVLPTLERPQALLTIFGKYGSWITIRPYRLSYRLSPNLSS